jgi:hypothetical protein
LYLIVFGWLDETSMTQIIVAAGHHSKSSVKICDCVDCATLQKTIANIEKTRSTRFFSLNNNVLHGQLQSLTRDGISHFVALIVDEKPTDLAIGLNIKTPMTSPKLEFICLMLIANNHVHCVTGLGLVGPVGLPNVVASYDNRAKKLCQATQLSVSVPTDIFTPAPMLEEFRFNFTVSEMVKCFRRKCFRRKYFRRSPNISEEIQMFQKN